MHPEEADVMAAQWRYIIQ